MTKPRIALAIGIVFISIFPVLVKMSLSPGLVSAFYRVAIASTLLVPFVVFSKKFKLPAKPMLILSMLCGLVFGLDIGLWNISIQNSTATQATLLTNLSPVWVGIGSYLFLKDRPRINFWIGTVVALFGMVLLVGFDLFLNFNFDLAFVFAMLSGVLYAIYMLLSKRVLSQIDVLSFMTISMLTSSLVLGILSAAFQQPFTGFSIQGWISLLVQGVICQLAAWLLISYATQHIRATRVSISLLGQAVLASVLAWWFLDEEVSFQMILGGIILLFGIRLTFYEKPLTEANSLEDMV